MSRNRKSRPGRTRRPNRLPPMNTLESAYSTISVSPLTRCHNHEGSAWLREQWGYVAAGATQACVHVAAAVATGYRGVHPIAALWAPGVIACPACIHVFDLAPGDPQDHTCDRCGVLVDLVVPLAYERGPGLLLMGLCTSCYRREFGEEPAHV